MNNHNAMFEYKGMNTLGVPDYTNQAPPKISKGKSDSVQNPSKIKKYLLNVHKMVCANLQCVNNHFAKFEYIGMNTVGVTDYTN